MPFTTLSMWAAFLLSLFLLYRFIYLRRIRYSIGPEQLVCEHGIIWRKTDYMELYRIVDFMENQSLLQQLCGLKTVSIFSMDRNTPRLDLTGIRHRDDIVTLVRERVEYNKRKREYMRLRIINWSLVLVAVLLLPQESKAQIAASNPLEWIALAEGNELINGQIENRSRDRRRRHSCRTASPPNSTASMNGRNSTTAT